MFTTVQPRCRQTVVSPRLALPWSSQPAAFRALFYEASAGAPLCTAGVFSSPVLEARGWLLTALIRSANVSLVARKRPVGYARKGPAGEGAKRPNPSGPQKGRNR